MRALNRESLLFRILRFLLALVLFVLLLVFLLIKPGEAVVAWMMPIGLLYLAGVGAVCAWELGRLERINRWYHAAHWTGLIVCAGGGALCIGAAVVWVIRWITQGQFAEDIIKGWVIVLGVLCLVGLLGALGLAAIGDLAERHETRRR